MSVHTAPAPSVDAYIERPTPLHNFVPIGIATVLLTVIALLAWEGYWRDQGVPRSYRNSDNAWTEQRRRVNHGEGDATLVLGSSRIFFGLSLDLWQQRTGVRPIQLGLQGTSPIMVLEDLAQDPDFHGRLLIDVAPAQTFTGRGFRQNVVALAKSETRSQRAGHWLSKNLIEPYFVFYSDDDFALFTVLARQSWPARPGVITNLRVRKISLMQADRQARLWDKVVNDPDYQALAKKIWIQNPRPMPTGDELTKHQALIRSEIQRYVKALDTLKKRGVAIVFVRFPVSGPFLTNEDQRFPRASTWDELIRQTGVPGVHFQDHASLQGYDLPEWSHLNANDVERFTGALLDIIEGDQLWQAH